jgi:hypothetical protein
MKAETKVTFHSQDGAVSIATCYGLDGQEQSTEGVRFMPPIQTSSRAHPAPYTMGTRSLSWGYSSWDMALTTHLYLALRLKKMQSYTSTPPLGLHGLLYSKLYLLPSLIYLGLL